MHQIMHAPNKLFCMQHYINSMVRHENVIFIDLLNTNHVVINTKKSLHSFQTDTWPLIWATKVFSDMKILPEMMDVPL